MVESLLAVGLQQVLLLSLAVALLRMARPLLLRCGAELTCAAWWLVPAMLLTPALPRPRVEPLLAVVQASGGAGAVRPTSLVMASPSLAVLGLSLWLAGTLAVLALQGWRQWRLARLGPILPAGFSPAVVGWLRPRLALPADFEQRFPPDERALILAHEAAHLRRHDNVWNLLATLLVALHWWNPLAWWAARRLQADQELACDAAVLSSSPGSGAAYVRALLAAHQLSSQAAPLASRWTSVHPLVERIAMLHHPHPASRRTAVLLASALAVCTGLAWAGQTAVPAAGAHIKLRLLVTQQVGERVNRLSLALAGPQDQAMRMESPGDGSETIPPLAMDLTAHLVDAGKVQIDAVISEGKPLAVIARPRLLIQLNEPALVEQMDAATQRRLSVVIVPSLFERP